jgi:CBS domain containing-hemolysin-like protein
MMELGMNTFVGLLSVLGLVALNGFFVAAEFALVSVRRSRIEEMVAQGSLAGKRVQKAIHDLDRYIAGTQIGITIASLALGWVGEPAVAHLIEPLLAWLPSSFGSSVSHAISVAIAFAFITFLHVVIGELVPKSIALQLPERVSLWVVVPMGFAVTVFRPLIWGLNGLGNHILRMLGFEVAGEHHGVHSVDELQILVRQSHEAGVLDDLERQMLHRTFRFTELTAGEVMIPRTDMVAVNIDLPAHDALAKIAASTHSRVPAYEKTLDHILGIILVQEVFQRLVNSKEITDIRDLVRPALFVPAGMTLDKLLESFRQQHSQFAVVIDEFGGTAGLITLEDVVEEVFGDFQDTLEAEQPDIQQQPNGRIIVRGDVWLEELRDKTGWNLFDEEVDTVAGYVMGRLGRVAKLNDVVETSFGRIQVINMSRVRITYVALIPESSAKDVDATTR